MRAARIVTAMRRAVRRRAASRRAVRALATKMENKSGEFLRNPPMGLEAAKSQMRQAQRVKNTLVTIIIKKNLAMLFFDEKS